MKRLTAILLIVALLPLALAAKDNKGHEGIHAISFNIRYANAEDGTNSWKYRYPAVAMMLDDQRPDVAGLQECLYEQFEYLQTSLDKLYKFVGVGRDDGKKAGEMMAIMYNPKTVSLVKWGTFWLSETPDVPGSESWDTACPRTCTWGRFTDRRTGKDFFLFNTHLDCGPNSAQTGGMKLILERLSGLSEGAFVVLAGDHNCRHGDAPAITARTVLCDARDVAESPDPGPRNTFHAFGKLAESDDVIPSVRRITPVTKTVADEQLTRQPVLYGQFGRQVFPFVDPINGGHLA